MQPSKNTPLAKTLITIVAAIIGFVLSVIGFIQLAVAIGSPDSPKAILVSGVLFSLLGAVIFSGMYGFWTTQEWGRRILVLSSVIIWSLSIPSVFHAWPEITIQNFFLHLLTICISGLILYYLSRTSTKALFRAKRKLRLEAEKNIPTNLGKWNWGAFLLNWIWGSHNNTNIAFLSFNPVLSLVMPFVLAIKGNKWAWQNNTWRNFEHFKSVQRKWAIAGFLFWAFLILSIASVYFGGNYIMKNSQPYQLSLNALKSNAKVIEALGTPLTPGFFVRGNISIIKGNMRGNLSINGSRRKNTLQYSIAGPKDTGDVFVSAIKNMQIWEIEIDLVIPTQNQKINIISHQQYAPSPEQLNLASTLNQQALELIRQKKYAEAEKLYRRSLSIRENELGFEHLDTLQSLDNLADLFRIQKQYTNAEKFYRNSVAFRKDLLGYEHPDLVISLNNLAGFLQSRKKYSEAAPLYRLALRIREKTKGPEHPDVTSYLINLADIYIDQKKYNEAEALFLRSLSILEKSFGPEHPYVANNLTYLVKLYQAQEKYSEVDSIYSRIREIRKKVPKP